MSGVVNISPENSGCVWLIILIIFFYGDPDLHDAIIHYLMAP